MIRVNGLCKGFQSGRGRVTALADLSFSLASGDFAAVVGVSGSGKPTLLNCLTGIERPDSDQIDCFGLPTHRLDARRLARFQRRELGIVFQRGNLLSYLTVAENIGLPLTLNGIGGAIRARRIATLLDLIGLESAARALPHELSGGETQRVSVARAIAHGPRLLLADEPTARLDTASGGRIVALIRDLGKETGCTVVVATHDPTMAAGAQRIIALRAGARIEEAS